MTITWKAFSAKEWLALLDGISTDYDIFLYNNRYFLKHTRYIQMDNGMIGMGMKDIGEYDTLGEAQAAGETCIMNEKEARR